MKVIVKSLQCGTTDENGDLDYNVYCDRISEIDESSCSEHLLKAQIFGDQSVDEAASEIWNAIGVDARFEMNRMFTDFKKNRRSDIIVAEVGDENDPTNSWVIVRYNCHGPWPAIFRRSDISYSNLLTFNDASKAFALWDNEHWYKHKDDGNDILDCVKRAHGIWH